MNRTDSRLTQDVFDVLHSERSINAASIDVGVQQGVVLLSGRIESDAEKWLVERTVGKVAGVVGVTSRLNVTPSQRETSTDEDIRRECEQVLETAIPGPNEEIRVMVSNGWVTLSGTVEWGYERWAAEAVISSLRGVYGVNGQITVRPCDDVA